METIYLSFEDNLKKGNEMERHIDNMLQKIGFYVIPKYLYIEKGAPCLFRLDCKYAVPDLDIALSGKRLWLEVKRKAHRDFYMDTGFPLRSLEHYVNTESITGNKVFILWIDEKYNQVYGDYLNNLLTPIKTTCRNKIIEYPTRVDDRFGKTEIMFNISTMKFQSSLGNFNSFGDSMNVLKTILLNHA